MTNLAAKCHRSVMLQFYTRGSPEWRHSLRLVAFGHDAHADVPFSVPQRANKLTQILSRCAIRDSACATTFLSQTHRSSTTLSCPNGALHHRQLAST